MKVNVVDTKSNEKALPFSGDVVITLDALSATQVAAYIISRKEKGPVLTALSEQFAEAANCQLGLNTAFHRLYLGYVNQWQH